MIRLDKIDEFEERMRKVKDGRYLAVVVEFYKLGYLFFDESK